MSDPARSGYECHGPMTGIHAPGEDQAGEPLIGAWWCESCGCWRHAFPREETQLRAIMESRMANLLKTFRPLVVALVMLWASPCFAEGLKLPSVILVGTATADLATTHHALATGRGYESNPLMGQSDARRIALKSVTTAGTIGLAHVLERHHPKIAQSLIYISAGVTGAVAIRNLKICQQISRY